MQRFDNIVITQDACLKHLAGYTPVGREFQKDRLFLFKQFLEEERGKLLPQRTVVVTGCAQTRTVSLRALFSSAPDIGYEYQKCSCHKNKSRCPDNKLFPQ